MVDIHIMAYQIIVISMMKNKGMFNCLLISIKDLFSSQEQVAFPNEGWFSFGMRCLALLCSFIFSGGNDFVRVGFINGIFLSDLSYS